MVFISVMGYNYGARTCYQEAQFLLYNS